MTGIELPAKLPAMFGGPNTEPEAPLANITAAEYIALLGTSLRTGSIDQQAEAAEKLARIESNIADDAWIITVCDRLWRPIAAVGDDMMDLSGVDPRNNVPTAALKVKGSSPLIRTFRKCKKEMVGVIVETAGLRHAFYVDTFDWEWTEDGWVGTANLRGIWDILNFMQIWPMWYFPIQAQPISHAVYIWGLCVVIESMVSECSLRLQSGIWEFVNNALSLNPDIRAWFATLLLNNGNIFQALKTPVYVVRTNPILDTSPLVARTVRMESCGTVIQDITRPYGVDVRVDLWLPGDPQPDAWAGLTQPTYVVSVVDRSQIEGPTKTVLDSVLRTVIDLGGAFGNIFEPLIRQVPGMDGVVDAPGIGINFVPPWAILIAPDEGQKGSVETCKISDHSPKGWQHIIGGRSPKWLNDLMNATFAWMIDSISIIIGFTGIPSDLLSGFLNNAFLAFQLIQLYSRRSEMGPYHPAIEVFHATQSAPYNIETFFAFINAFWDSRGYTSAIATFRNGDVYTYGKDVFRGGLISLAFDNRTQLLTDYVESVTFRISPTQRDIMVQIGDGKAEESPLMKHQRFITGLFEAYNVLTLAPQS
jgi:hypothetical protein